jgi:hypothetical protein
MFGLFGGDKRKVQKLRLDFEDIRQRFLFRTEWYAQYNFAVVYQNDAQRIQELRSSLAPGHSEKRKILAAELKHNANEAWRFGQRSSGFEGEDIRAAADALALLSISVEAEGYETPDALTLCSDISAFEKVVIDKRENSPPNRRA